MVPVFVCILLIVQGFFGFCYEFPGFESPDQDRLSVFQEMNRTYLPYDDWLDEPPLELFEYLEIPVF